MDRYITNTETQIYGPKLRDNTRAYFKGAPKQVVTFLDYLIGLQARADETIATALADSSGAAAALSKIARGKEPKAATAYRLLVGFRSHLAAKRALDEWNGSDTMFFRVVPSHMGQSDAELLGALEYAQKGLARDKSVPGGKKFDKQFSDAAKGLAAEMKKSGVAVKGARAQLSEQGAEKRAWLRTYRGFALIVEGLLVLEGKHDDLSTVVPHLSVPGGKKKKQNKKPAASTPTPTA